PRRDGVAPRGALPVALGPPAGHRGGRGRYAAAADASGAHHAAARSGSRGAGERVAVRGPAARRARLAALRAAITALALWLVLREYGLDRLLDVFRELDWRWVALAGVVAVGQVLVMAWRWRLLCDLLLATPPTYLALLVALGRSLLLGQLMP